MRLFFLAMALFGICIFSSAQNVGIGTGSPHALLQLSNGLANRKIVIFETANNDHQYLGFGNNNGTLRYQVDAAAADHVFYAGTSSSTSRELLRIKGNGNVGIGVNPVTKLDISGTNGWDLINGEGDMRIGTASYRLKFGVALDGGGVGAAGIMHAGGIGILGIGAGGKFLVRVDGQSSITSFTGNVGIGTSLATAPLTFPAVLGKKITLFPGASGDAGLAVAGNRLQIFSDNPNADVAFGYDAAGTFNERFAVKPNGALALLGNIGGYANLLTSNAGNGAAQWKSMADLIQTYYSKSDLQQLPTTLDTWQNYWNASMNMNLAQNSKVLLWVTAETGKGCALGPCSFSLMIRYKIDGVDGGSANNIYVQGFSFNQLNQQTQCFGPYILNLAQGAHTITFDANNRYNAGSLTIMANAIVIPK